MCTKQHEVICYTFGSPRTGQFPCLIGASMRSSASKLERHRTGQLACITVESPQTGQLTVSGATHNEVICYTVGSPCTGQLPCVFLQNLIQAPCKCLRALQTEALLHCVLQCVAGRHARPLLGRMATALRVSFSQSRALSLRECWGLLLCQMGLAPHLLSACRQLCLCQGL